MRAGVRPTSNCNEEACDPRSAEGVSSRVAPNGENSANYRHDWINDRRLFPAAVAEVVKRPCPWSLMRSRGEVVLGAGRR
jgi:hypothetical protein